MEKYVVLCPAKKLAGTNPERAGRLLTPVSRPLFPAGDDRGDDSDENGAVGEDRNTEGGEYGK